MADCRLCVDRVDVVIVYPGREPPRPRRCYHCGRPLPVLVVELDARPVELVDGHEGPVRVRAATEREALRPQEAISAQEGAEV